MGTTILALIVGAVAAIAVMQRGIFTRIPLLIWVAGAFGAAVALAVALALGAAASWCAVWSIIGGALSGGGLLIIGLSCWRP